MLPSQTGETFVNPFIILLATRCYGTAQQLEHIHANTLVLILSPAMHSHQSFHTLKDFGY